MVEPPQQPGTKYVSNRDGAPPLPPPGGYKGARRAATSLLIASPPAASATDEIEDEPREKGSIASLVVLLLAAVFALFLVVAAVTGGGNLVYNLNVVAVQLVVVLAVVGFMFTPRGRKFAGIALAITLVLNVGTVGAVSALRTNASGTYEDTRTPEQKKMAAYPGVKNVTPESILAKPSLEDVRGDAEDAMKAVREALTAEFGFTWVQAPGEETRAVRNGYGGDSMLVDYTSGTWTTNEPVHGYDTKLRVMEAVDRALSAKGYPPMWRLNDPSVSSLDPSVLTKFYGSADPHTQAKWEWGTSSYRTGVRMYANIDDLSNDPTGGARAEREAMQQRTGAPLEGLSLLAVSDQLLPKDKVEAFKQKIEELK